MHHAIRTPAPEDALELARLHVAGWGETYAGLLPQSEIDARTHALRLAQWQGAIAAGRSRIALIPGVGFAEIGPQRDDGLAAQGYTEELYCLYVLAAAHGSGAGAALLAAVAGPQPYTAVVLAGNARACAFYEKSGGRLLGTRTDGVGPAAITDRIYGFRP